MAISLQDAQSTLKANSFAERSWTSKVVEYESENNGRVLYLRLNQGFPSHADVVVHPDTPLAGLLDISGVEVNKRVSLRHSSNMTRFPKRINEGQDPEHYGKALHISTATALAALCLAYGKRP